MPGAGEQVPGDLAGRTALVTGAESGIGREIARRLAARGAAVIVNYLADTNAATAVVEDITACGGTARTAQADVSDPAQVARMFTDIERLDSLVNNAATGIPGELGDIEVNALERVFAVNVTGALLCAQAALPLMGTGGRIVNLSSSTTVFPLPGMSVYTASKAAIKAFTEVWAKELGSRGINVNSVMPGPTSPGMTDRASVEIKQAMAAASPYGRIGEAAEIADVVAFLCSDAARWVSGQHILVNGAANA